MLDVLLNAIHNSLAGERYPVDYFWTCASVFVFFIGWTLLYQILCYSQPTVEKEWHCRMVTFMHAVIICPLCAWSLFLQDRMPFDPANHGGASTPLQHLIFIICLGYFFFDFSWCLIQKTEGPVMLVHHGCSILGIGIALFVGRWGTELSATIAGAESTNPLLQIRWFLRAKGHRDSKAIQIVELSFMILFGFMRFGLGSILLFVYLRNPRTDFLGRLAGVVIYLISLLFWVSICNYAWHKISSRAKNADIDQKSASSSYDKVSNGFNSAGSTYESKKAQ